MFWCQQPPEGQLAKRRIMGELHDCLSRSQNSFIATDVSCDKRENEGRSLANHPAYFNHRPSRNGCYTGCSQPPGQDHKGGEKKCCRAGITVLSGHSADREAFHLVHQAKMNQMPVWSLWEWTQCMMVTDSDRLTAVDSYTTIWRTSSREVLMGWRNGAENQS